MILPTVGRPTVGGSRSGKEFHARRRLLTALPPGMSNGEFMDATDLGLTFGQPQIALISASEWAVIFGNGYNNSV